MARPKKTIRTVFQNIGLPEDLAARLDLELYSDLEEKIPFGAKSDFFTALVRKHFAEQEATQDAVKYLLTNEG